MTKNTSRDPVEFHFDFSSPFAYFAAQQIDDLAARHGRTVRWQPFLLGAVFKETGGRPITQVPMKAGYALHDLARTARQHSIAWQLPDLFPFSSISPCRAFYWLEAQDPEAAKALAKALYRRAFTDGEGISTPQQVVAVAETLGHEAASVEAGMKDPVVKDHLRGVVQAAIDREIFGSPFFFVDGEPFWGHDRLAMLEAWLETGGW
jgi:2-hydroxychromene-2-carboxylate isomerase